MNFRKLALFATVFAFLTCLPGWAAAPCDGVQNLIYCQGFDGTGNAYSSQNDTNGFGLFAQVYDNFSVNSNVIDSVHWVGAYFNPPNQGPITGWTVDLYADAGGQPGALLLTHSEAGTAGETFLGNFGGFPTYEYWVMGLTWNVTPGTQYWLSVYPDLGFPPQWGWSSGTGGDGISYQDFFGARSQLAADMAFALDGQGGGEIPEPGTLIMLGTGVLGLAGVIRRKLF
jgi:hypothetical protein